jgi:uncharacterized protein YcfJ
MRTRLIAATLALATALAPLSCTPTQEGALLGAGTGAAAGALIDHHHRGRGAAIGAVAGGIIGGLVGYSYEFSKFCPACGRRFHYTKVYCPYDGYALQPIQ